MNRGERWTCYVAFPKGSVIGPLIVAGILIEKDRLDLLRDLHVKDSKLLSPNRREELNFKIRKIVKDYEYSILTTKSIDEAIKTGRKLNFLEANAMAGLICRLGPDIVYVDAVGPIPERFALKICQMANIKAKIVAEHKADVKYPVVSAASILAKVKRDEIVSELRIKYGNFGSGYPSDWRTKKFLKRWIRKFGKIPPFARSSWMTVKNLQDYELSDFEPFRSTTKKRKN